MFHTPRGFPHTSYQFWRQRTQANDQHNTSNLQETTQPIFIHQQREYTITMYVCYAQSDLHVTHV